MGDEYINNVQALIEAEYKKSIYFLSEKEADILNDLILEYRIKNNVDF